LAERGERISPFMLGQFAAAGISLIQVFAKCGLASSPAATSCEIRAPP
jgi:hypothetical protein